MLEIFSTKIFEIFARALHFFSCKHIFLKFLYPEMEKFSKFTDETVGVNGFVQQPYKPSLINIIIGWCLLVLRFPFAILFYILFYSIETILPYCSCISPLASLLQFIGERPLARGLLFCLGFHHINGIYVPHKQSIRLRSSLSNPSSTIQKNDIILCNLSSYIDLLYLVSVYSPLFIIRNKEGKLVPVSFFTALENYQSLTTITSSTSTSSTSTTTVSSTITEESIKELLNQKYSAPLVLFPEQAPSNNKVILSFPSYIQTFADYTISSMNNSKRTFHILGLKYDDVHINKSKQFSSGQNPSKLDLSSSSFLSPCFITGQFSLHVISLMMQFSNHLSIWQLPPGYNPQPQDFTKTSTSSIDNNTVNPTLPKGVVPLANGILKQNTTVDTTATTTNTNIWSSTIRQALATLLNITPVRQDYQAHAEFIRAYHDSIVLKKLN